MPIAVSRAIYIVESPFTRREENQNGTRALMALGLEVEFWEVAPIYLPGSEEYPEESPVLVEPRRFTSLEDLVQACGVLTASDLVFVMCGVYRHQIRSHRRMLRALSRSNATLAAVSQGQLPQLVSRFRVTSLRDFGRKLGRAPLRVLAPRGGKASFRGVATRWIMGTRPLDWIWAGVTISSIDSSMIGTRTRVQFLHNRDYEHVLCLHSPPARECSKAVLLDHMGFHHPDAATLGVDLPRLDEEAFFATVREALDSYEGHSGLTVEVAAHPRAIPGSLDAYYGGRHVRYGETPEALASAKVVIITNATTAVGLAVALERPMIALVADTFWSVIADEVKALSALLSIPVVDLDRDVPQWPQLEVDAIAYGDYMRRYVKIPGTLEAPFWDVVAGHIQVSRESRVQPFIGE